MKNVFLWVVAVFCLSSISLADEIRSPKSKSEPDHRVVTGLCEHHAKSIDQELQNSKLALKGGGEMWMRTCVQTPGEPQVVAEKTARGIWMAICKEQGHSGSLCREAWRFVRPYIRELQSYLDEIDAYYAIPGING